MSDYPMFSGVSAGLRMGLLLFIALFSASAALQAQPENCTSCGPEDMTPYMTGTIQRLACIDDCVFEINYRYRACSNGNYEFILDGFTPLTPANCDSVNIYELIRTSGVGSLLDFGHTLFGIPNPDLGYSLCVAIPACMQQDPVTGVISGCTTVCCSNCYFLHTDPGTGQVLIDASYIATSSGPITCTPPCMDVCGALDVDLPGPAYTPCDFGCSPCGWDDPTPYQVQVVEGCVNDCRLTVTFEWRECGGGYREMNMTGFCVDNSSWCSSNEYDMIQAAIGLVLQEAHTLFAVSNPTTTPYRIWFSQPTCMAFDPTDGCFKACSEACCSNRYDLLLDGNGKVTTVSYDVTNGTWGDQNCTGTINGAPCTNRCNTLIELETGVPLTFDCVPPGGYDNCDDQCFWKLRGNLYTDPAVNFLGTIDNVDLVFRTNNTERMRILSSGRVGIANNNPDAGSLLHVGTVDGSRIRIGSQEYIEDGFAEILLSASPGSNGVVSPADDCQTDLGSSTNRWEDFYLCGQTFTTSDIRDKSDIESLQYGLDHIMALNPVQYNLLDGNNTPRLGLIAQEVLPLIPEVVYDPMNEVRTDEEGNVRTDWQADARMGVAYQDLIPVLVKAIQEQQQRIQTLEAATGGTSTSIDNQVGAFSEILLEQNQPNPFAEETTVAYYVPDVLAGRVELVVRDTQGREVLSRFAIQTGSPHSQRIDAAQLPSGVYVYGITVDGQLVVSKKLMLIR